MVAFFYGVKGVDEAEGDHDGNDAAEDEPGDGPQEPEVTACLLGWA